MEKVYDLIVIGGGAGGMSAAITARRNGKSVVVIEKEDKLAKKILMTGNGKCNLSNADMRVCFYNTPDVAETIKIDVTGFFASLGLATKDVGGRIYPYSESALSVVWFLRKNYDGDVVLGKEVNTIDEKDGLFVVGGYKGRNVLLATGSNATKGTESGYLYEKFGHKSTPRRPSLVPLVTDTTDIKGLSGLRAKCALTVYENGEKRESEQGELLFKDNGLSGIVSMSISAYIARRRVVCDLSVDFAPDLSLYEVKENVKRGGAESLLHKAIAQSVEKQAARRGITVAECVKNFVVKNARTGDVKQAQAVCGGLNASEFDENMQSKKKKGLYACGEVLDVDGACGGYNLHYAFASGIKAGGSV